MDLETTYCQFHLKCMDGEDCPRKLSAAIALQAHIINGIIPVYTKKPKCFKSINNEEEND